MAANCLVVEEVTLVWLSGKPPDEVEGEDYRRIMVPVETGAEESVTANIYEIAK